MLFVYWFLWPLRLVWLLVCCLYKDVYLQIFKYVSFGLHGCCGEWEGGPVNQVNHTSWVAIVTPTDRPKSVRNRCVIELFCGIVYVVTVPFCHFCWCRGFCHRTESDLFLFLLWSIKETVLWSGCDSISSLNLFNLKAWVLSCEINLILYLTGLWNQWYPGYSTHLWQDHQNVCRSSETCSGHLQEAYQHIQKWRHTEVI